MKNLTKSDLVNIEAFKQLIKCVSNDITEVKQGKAAPSEKANKIMQLYRQRIQLISQATEKYSHINWLDEAIGTDNSFDRSLKDTARIKAEQIAVFNYNSKLNLN
jgi:hypothetical protein